MTETEAAFANLNSDIAMNREFIEDQLRSDAKNLIRRMESVLEALDNDHHLNSLGVIQGLGLDIDIACARRADLINQAKKVVWLQEKVS